MVNARKRDNTNEPDLHLLPVPTLIYFVRQFKIIYRKLDLLAGSSSNLDTCSSLVIRDWVNYCSLVCDLLEIVISHKRIHVKCVNNETAADLEQEISNTNSELFLEKSFIKNYQSLQLMLNVETLAIRNYFDKVSVKVYLNIFFVLFRVVAYVVALSQAH